MLVASVAVTFVVLTLLSLPIVFALGLAGFTGLLVGHFSLTKLPSALVAGSQSWVLLAIPTFVFAGSLMERCGMSYALVDLARALVGWVRGGLGLSVVLAEYFFSGISGSMIADVSAIGSMLTPPMLRAGYKPEPAALLYYRNVTVREMVTLVHESALLTAAVVFLLSVATVYQFLMGMLGVPAMLGELLQPLEGRPWLFLSAVSLIVIMFGMVLEGLPAACVLVPVV